MKKTSKASVKQSQIEVTMSDIEIRDVEATLRERVNGGPFDEEELRHHVEQVAKVLKETEKSSPQDNINRVAPEGEGHGILVKYDFYLGNPHLPNLLEAGYAVTSMDKGRAFLMPFKGEIEVKEMHPHAEF